MDYYLCDGQKYGCCEHYSCYMNGGKCRYTTDILHAENEPSEMKFKQLNVFDRLEVDE